MTQSASEKIKNAWTTFKPTDDMIGMLYQAPEAKKGKDRITASVLSDVVETYKARFGVYPEAILVAKGDDPEKLSKLVGCIGLPEIGFANFMSNGYGYIFLKHSEEIANKHYQGHGD